MRGASALQRRFDDGRYDLSFKGYGLVAQGDAGSQSALIGAHVRLAGRPHGTLCTCDLKCELMEIGKRPFSPPNHHGLRGDVGCGA